MRTRIEDNEHPGRKVTLDYFVVSFQGRLGGDLVQSRPAGWILRSRRS